MSTQETTLGRQACALHDDRPAVELCADCGRAVCLSCAIPVRGRVLCPECTARLAGVPAPPEPARVLPSRWVDVAVAVLFGVGLAMTVPPWDRFGTLTSVLSAWKFLEGWAVVASVALLAGTAAALAPLLWRPRWTGRASGGLRSALAALAATATAVALFGDPDFVIHTPAPYVALAVSTAAGLAGLVRVRWRP